MWIWGINYRVEEPNKEKKHNCQKKSINYFRFEAKTSVLERACKIFYTNINVKVKINALFLLQLHENYTDGINDKKGWL